MLNRRVVGGDYLYFGQMHAVRGAAYGSARKPVSVLLNGQPENRAPGASIRVRVTRLVIRGS